MTLREIDAIIAEHVMQWKHVRFTRTDVTTFVMFMPEPDALEQIDRHDDAVIVMSGNELNAPLFTVDMIAAMKIRDEVATWSLKQQAAFNFILQQAISRRLGLERTIFAIEVFLLFKPQDICGAALYVVGQKEVAEELAEMKL